MADKFRTAPHWEDLRFFIALARHGSLSATARVLGVNHATVSRRITGLETALGARLFERTGSGYALTEAGRRVLEDAAPMEQAAGRISPGAMPEQPLGRVRITVTPSIAEGFLLPRLAGFQAVHPGLDIDLIADRRAISLQRREADIALRLARPLEGELVARRLVGLGFGFYATPDWPERIAAGEAPRFIAFDEGGSHLPEALWLTRRFPGARQLFRANSQVAQAMAARAGGGLALLPHFIGACDPELVPVTLAETPPGRELWLLMRPGEGEEPGLRMVVDFLAGLFRAERALFEDGSAA
ncbi:LysR family transcriptional regulator [Azorhizobium doebereinerae]|uniref:LysR family transcriptional regulator n=1 Tax=Azorhizobium doebereinerae TaxID=281091 RepID=UPI0003F94D1E|nr:LysR family transcriptional regulator [Azorhizobium doebereinerae]